MTLNNTEDLIQELKEMTEEADDLTHKLAEHFEWLKENVRDFEEGELDVKDLTDERLTELLEYEDGDL